VHREVDFTVHCESKCEYSPIGETRNLDPNLQHKESYKLTLVESHMQLLLKKSQFMSKSKLCYHRRPVGQSVVE
jgi:hypothetical protein